MTYLIILLAITILFLFCRFSEIQPDKAFWIALLLVLDPGGWLNEYIGRWLPGYLMTIDLFVPLLFLPLGSSKISFNIFFKDKKVSKLFFYLIFISAYLLIVYGLIVPENNLKTWAYFVYVRRYHIISPILLIPSYIFAKRSLQLHYKYTVKTAVVVLTLYLLSIFIHLGFVPVIEMERFKDSEIYRYILPSNGHMTFLTLISLTVILIRIKIPFRNHLYYSGVVMLLALFLSLTRGPIISMLVQMLVCVFLITRIFKIPYVVGMWKNVVYFFIFFFLIALIVPKQTLGIKETFSVTIMELAGKKKEGTTQGRTLNEIPRQIAVFKKNPVFGAGYQRRLHEGGLSGDSIDATDTPYMASWAMYGIVGTSLFIVMYLIIMRQIILHIKNLKVSFSDPLTVIYFITLSSYFISHLIFPNSLFSEYIKKVSLLGQSIIWGILYAVMNNIRSDRNAQKDTDNYL